MKKFRFILLNFIALAITCWTTNIQAASPKISIITIGIGARGTSFPPDLAALWEPLSVSGQAISQSITLQCIDVTQQKLVEFVPPEPKSSFFDKFAIQSEKSKQLSRLKKIATALTDQEYKIPDQYADSTNPITQKQKEWMQEKIEELKKSHSPANIIYFNHAGNNDPGQRIYTKAKDVREYIQKKLSEAGSDQADEAALTYLVIYQSGEKDIADSSSASAPPVKDDHETLPEGVNVSHTEIKPVKIEGKNVCNQQLLLQGIQFISMAKMKSTQALKTSDLNNAFQLFDSAAKEANVAGGCCAKALMNRGIARDLLGESNLAFTDLKAAEQCDSQNTEVHYNLACHYSKHSTKANPQLDLALQELTVAIEVGFKDCDQISHDPDLSNLRGDKDFKDKLRKMLHQHGQYCIVELTPKK